MSSLKELFDHVLGEAHKFHKGPQGPQGLLRAALQKMP